LKIVPICLLFILSFLAPLGRELSGTPSAPEANPGRPTVSAPATLTPVGYLQFENGVLFAEDSDSYREPASVLSFVFLCIASLDSCRWFVNFSECCDETRAE
jgi:hypothetical protein